MTLGRLRSLLLTIAALTAFGGDVRAEDSTWLGAFSDSFPAVSPDGATVLFQSDRGGHGAIFAASASGGPARVLVDTGDHPTQPSWSPDQSHIAFVADVNGQQEVFIARADGAERRRLTFDPGADYHPRFSPDGARLLFNSARGAGSRPAGASAAWGQDIYSIGLDGQDLQRHTHCPVSCTYPALSPDGRTLAYRESLPRPGLTQDGQAAAFDSEIMVADLSGGPARSISDSPAFDAWPAWSPDGQRLYFGSRRGAGPGLIFRADLNGGVVQPVTQTLYTDRFPAVSPDGRTLYFVRHIIRSGAILGVLSQQVIAP